MYNQAFGNNNGLGTFKKINDGNFTGGFNAYSGNKGDFQPGFNLQPVNWNRVNLNIIHKNLYHEDTIITHRSEEEIDNWFAQNEVILDGSNIPRPITEFRESRFPGPILNLLCKNYTLPTTIQSISWPVAMSGRDIISIAKTGSGKTLGFILPAIIHIMAQPKRVEKDGPIVLVLLPTRELAQQVEQVAKDYCLQMGISLTCCFGGASKLPQVTDLKRGVDICVATPGRLLDFLESCVTNLLRCSYLVLDEADRMLDMGFEPQIRKIVSNIRIDRQTLMFSATWPKDVRTLAASFQSNPVFLNVGSMELSANHNIDQNVIVLSEYDKPTRLIQLLSRIGQETECKTIIFVETKRKADELTSGMRQSGWPALCIHGDKSQSERDYVMAEFRAGRTPILLATDVAARGLDVTDIKFVINYDYPKNSEDYVHRIGRTGRRDQKGTSYTFFTSANAPKARDLIKVLEEAHQQIPLQLAQMAGFNGNYSNFSAFRGRELGDGSNDYSGRYNNSFR